MSDLTSQHCIPCRGGEPPLTQDEIDEMLPGVPGWSVVDDEGVPKLRRQFSYKTFKHALELTIAVGNAAESEGHHPRIITEWGAVTVEWWTHKIKGLHSNDFIMAARTNEIARK